MAGFKNVALREIDKILDSPPRGYESVHAIGFK